METMVIFRRDGQWMVSCKSNLAVLGQREVNTPFKASTPAAEVLAIICDKNPDRRVVLQTN